MPAAIEDYGLIGDATTVALISRFGSIDWLYLPRIDSDACFAKLLVWGGRGSSTSCRRAGPSTTSSGSSRAWRVKCRCTST